MSYRCTCDDCGAEYETDSPVVADGWERRHDDLHDYDVEEVPA